MGRMRTTVAGFAIAGVTSLALAGAGAGIASAQGAAPVATIPNLMGESTSVKLDSGFTDALTSLKVEPGVLGSATLDDGSVEFPITGGNVTVYSPGTAPQGEPFVQGMIMHEGSGLSLTAGDTEVNLEDFVVDPGDPATLTGKVTANGETVAESVKLFDLDGSTLEPLQTDPEAGTATLTGTTVRLSQEAATALNSAFDVDAIKGGTDVGIATIVVNLPGSGGGSGEPSQMPEGGMETGGGTSTVDIALVGAGLAALTAAGVTVAVARRRRPADQV